MAEEEDDGATGTDRVGRGLGFPVALVLLYELLVLSGLVLIAFVPLVLELGRPLIGLPVQLAEPTVYLSVVWVAASIVGTVGVTITGRLATATASASSRGSSCSPPPRCRSTWQRGCR